MEISRIWAVYFSPAGSTKQVVLTIAGQIGKKLQKEICEINYTEQKQRGQTYHFGQDELVVFGVPVYAGRVPNKVLPDIEKGFCGEGTAFIPVAVYGNRSFDDALMELKLVMEERGFRAVAAAAVVSRHVFSATLAAGRPDADDWKQICAFAGKAAQKLNGKEPFTKLSVPGNQPVGNYYTPLQEDGTPARFLKAKPVTDSYKCSHCGICATVCPMGSIDVADESLVTGVCIKCHACVRSCPAGAKSFTDAQFLSHVKMLEQTYSRRAENGFFY